MRTSHLERRSYKYAPVQYVSDTHHERPDAPLIEHNKMNSCAGGAARPMKIITPAITSRSRGFLNPKQSGEDGKDDETIWRPNVSGNFDHDPRDDDEKPKRRSYESRVKDRAQLWAGMEFGDQTEWERYKEEAGKDVKFDDYIFWLGQRGFKLEASYNSTSRQIINCCINPLPLHFRALPS